VVDGGGFIGSALLLNVLRECADGNGNLEGWT